MLSACSTSKRDGFACISVVSFAKSTSSVVQGLDQEANWADLLSGGEQQRLGFGRLFWHNPTLAIMDESTSALDSALEVQCMKALQARGISMISVGHRPSLVAYHDLRLKVISLVRQCVTRLLAPAYQQRHSDVRADLGGRARSRRS